MVEPVTVGSRETAEVLDVAGLATLFGVGPELDDEIREFLISVVDLLRPSVDQLRTALVAADRNEAHHAAHAAKGAAQSMCATAIAALCAAIEQSLERGDLAAAQARGAELQPQIELLARRVQALG